MDERNLVAALELRIEQARRTVQGLTWFVLPNEMFAIECGDGYLLFAPLHGVILLLTKAGLATVLLHESGSLAGALTTCAVEVPRATLDRLDAAAAPPPSRHVDAGSFAPTRLTLSPTAACQLRCEYCYIRGGDRPRHMPWKIAEAAIRFVAENCAAAQAETMGLMFHGQGEPTANWPLFVRCVQFAEEMCAARGMRPGFSLVSNGVLSKGQVAFLAQHKFSMSLSLDSLRESNDRQRRMRSGASAFDRVMDTMRWLEEQGVGFGIRSTVTPQTVDEMREFVSLLTSKVKCQSIQFEPLCSAGRAENSIGLLPSLLEQFARNFPDADVAALTGGSRVDYAAARMTQTRAAFCGAHGSDLNFMVSTEGLVSSCNEVLEPADPRAGFFIYGKYDENAGRFQFDEEKLARLLDLDVSRMECCRDCFLKWHCAGDCLAKFDLGRLHDPGIGSSDRCTLNRTLGRRELFKRVLLQGSRS